MNIIQRPQVNSAIGPTVNSYLSTTKQSMQYSLPLNPISYPNPSIPYHSFSFTSTQKIMQHDLFPHETLHVGGCPGLPCRLGCRITTPNLNSRLRLFVGCIRGGGSTALRVPFSNLGWTIYWPALEMT